MTDIIGLQLEHAEFDDSAVARACATCLTPLSGSYYEVNAQSVCASCCEGLRRQLTGGSRARRVLLSLAAGAVAAAAGSLLYYAILAITGYEFGLIAIAVGVAVGRAVHWGSEGRGGWAYQSLAIGLTYLSIVTAFVPMIFTELAKGTDTTQSAAVHGSPSPTPVSTQPAEASSVPPPGDKNVLADAPSLAKLLLLIVVLIALACAAPFLAGIGNIIGLIIIGIGLYEAWKINRRPQISITGPHLLAATPAPASIES